MKIFCSVWGSKHQSLLKSALLTSLSWPKNKAAVENAEWMIVTISDEEFKTASATINSYFPNAKCKPFIYPDIVNPQIRMEATLLKALEAAIEYCLKKHSPMLMATPDYIFGDGTIDCFKILGAGDACVSIAHMRCLPNVMEFISTDSAPANKYLIGLATRYPHPTWSKSEIGIHDGYTVYGGIQWSKLDDDTTLVRHWLPAPFYANFKQEDLEFFRNFKEGYYNGHLYLKTFALWDHLWAASLIDQGRLRLIGSSDAALMIEVTDADKNHPRINPIHMTNKDGYVLNQPHNHIQKQFVSVFRT